MEVSRRLALDQTLIESCSADVSSRHRMGGGPKRLDGHLYHAPFAIPHQHTAKPSAHSPMTSRLFIGGLPPSCHACSAGVSLDGGVSLNSTVSLSGETGDFSETSFSTNARIESPWKVQKDCGSFDWRNAQIRSVVVILLAPTATSSLSRCDDPLAAMIGPCALVAEQ